MLGHQTDWPHLRIHARRILIVTFSAWLMLIGCAPSPEHQVAEPVASTPGVQARITSTPESSTGTSLPANASPTLFPTLSVEQWDSLAAPTPQPGHFWASHQPQRTQPLGFGTLVPDRDTGRHVTVRAYELAITLPTTPAELDVYLLGDYPRRHFGVHNATLRNKQVQGGR